MLMKKIFTFVSLLFVTSMAFAQEAKDYLQFIDANGNVVADGATVDVTEPKIEDYGAGFVIVEMPTGISVKNTFDEALNMRVDFNITALANGDFQICFPTECRNFSKVGPGSTGTCNLGAEEVRSLMSEWMPVDETIYGTTTVELQANIVTALGTVESYGPKITVNMIYKDPASVNNLEGDKATVVGRYSLAGQRIGNSQKGLNILRMSNGKAVKVMAK